MERGALVQSPHYELGIDENSNGCIDSSSSNKKYLSERFTAEDLTVEIETTKSERFPFIARRIGAPK